MATCTKAAFEASCNMFPCLNPKQQQAILMRLMILELAALGGPDYTDDFEALNADVAAIRGLMPEQQMGALIGIYRENAIEAGASVGTTNQLLEQSVEYVNAQDQLSQYLLFLTCQLGAHASQA